MNDGPETRLERSPDRASSYRICRRKLRLPICILALRRAVEKERSVATALANELILVTRNTSEFRCVLGVTLEYWR
jgi:hypothetical protein